jgi:hypothetical protein
MLVSVASAQKIQNIHSWGACLNHSSCGIQGITQPLVQQKIEGAADVLGISLYLSSFRVN